MLNLSHLLQAGLKRTSEHPCVPPVSTNLPLLSVEKELCDSLNYGEIVTVFNAKTLTWVFSNLNLLKLILEWLLIGSSVVPLMLGTTALH